MTANRIVNFPYSAKEPTIKHRHHKWLSDIAQQMQSDFEEAHTTATNSSGVQEAGHHGESIWGRFLQEWLPPQYEIGYRKYILLENEAHDGSDISGETDIVIFRPSYPTALRKRTHILLSGVAAAFSSKLTLDRAGLENAVKEAAKVRQAAALPYPLGTGKILAPLLYGVLAHTHPWKAPASRPVETITSALTELDCKFSQLPREGLDLLCVADLNCWSKAVLVTSPKEAKKIAPNGVEPSGHINYSYINIACGDSDTSGATGTGLPPVAYLVGLLYQKLSYYDDSLSALANGFRATGTGLYGMSSSTSDDGRAFQPASLLAPDTLDAFDIGLLDGAYW